MRFKVINKKILIIWTVAAMMTCFFVTAVAAHPGFLSQFSAHYPTTDTDNASCATCHATTSGGSPWNQFGRDLLANGASGLGPGGDVTPILTAIELLNSDQVAGNNVTEIEASTQPGWCDEATVGCENRVYFSNGDDAGEGVPPDLPLDNEEGNDPEADIDVTQAVIDFGQIVVGESASADVNISNLGNLDLTLATAISGAPFSISNEPDSVVPPMGLTSATVTYSPTMEGADSGNFTLNSNDPDTPMFIVSLAGEGVVQPPDPTVACPAGNELTDPIVPTIRPGDIEVALQTIADGFVNPVFGLAPPRDRRSLFVLDQTGEMWRINLRNGQKYVFLDLSDRLVELGLFGINYDERGLLGAAFAPDFSRSGKFYTYTSEPASGVADFSTMPQGVEPDHQSVVMEWQVAVPLTQNSVVDPNSGREIMRIDQPQFNHNGGALMFGPDRLLYISLGDGGGADDQGDGGDNIGHSLQGNAQDTGNILGAILRINPRGSNAVNGQYGIPADNPFVENPAEDRGGEAGCADGKCDEIFAYGFRNGWRASFDSSGNGVLMVADVGQNDIEEVDIVKAGGNYGWRIKDGSFCFDDNGVASGFVTDATFIPPPDIIDPVAEYDHDEGLAITGGYVYRGQSISDLRGRYVFGDWAPTFTDPTPGRLFYLARRNLDGSDPAQISEILEMQLPLSTNGVDSKVNGFAQDGRGELYIIGSDLGLIEGNTGKVQKIVPITP